MSRIILIFSLAARVAGGTQSANTIESANQAAWAQARLACADVGVDPGSAAFETLIATSEWWAMVGSSSPRKCEERRMAMARRSIDDTTAVYTDTR